MKPSFWAITWIFRVEGKVCDCHPSWHPRPQSRHTEQGCEGERGWELLLPQRRGADRGADCNPERIPFFTVLIAQPLHSMVAGAQYNYIQKENKNHVRKIGENFEVGLICYILVPGKLLCCNQHSSKMVLSQCLPLFLKPCSFKDLQNASLLFLILGKITTNYFKAWYFLFECSWN